MRQPADYPAKVAVDTPDDLARWRPLVQWILAIPHLIIASALGSLSGAIAVVSWFVILFTGRLPAGLATLHVMTLRYSMRAHLYAGFLYDRYPPYDFATSTQGPGGSPVAFAIAPTLENRDRLTVGLRFLWAIPALLFAFVVAVAGSVCWMLAFFAVIATGRWPVGLRTWVMKMQRVSVRLNAYVSLLTDEYPPFATD